MFASTFSRPRCAIPRVTSSMPASAARWSTSSSRGMADSAPSSENRRWPTYLVCRKDSNASAAPSRSRTCSCSAGSGRSAARSTRCWIQTRSSGSWMCMYSIPTRRQ